MSDKENIKFEVTKILKEDTKVSLITLNARGGRSTAEDMMLCLIVNEKQIKELGLYYGSNIEITITPKEAQ